MSSIPGLSPTLPVAQGPMSAPRAASPCPSDTAAGPVSAPHGPAQPWALPSWACLQAHSLSQCRPVPREVPSVPLAARLLAGAVGQALPAEPLRAAFGVTAASPPVPQISLLAVSFGSPCLPPADGVEVLGFSSSSLPPSPLRFFRVGVI